MTKATGHLAGIVAKASTITEQIEALNDREREAVVEHLELEMLRPIMPYRWRPPPTDGGALIALIDTVEP